MPVLKDLKSQVNKTKKQLASQYRMMSSAHNRYNLLFRQMHEMQTIHLSWPENQGILFFYISQTLQINRISFMASLLNAVL